MSALSLGLVLNVDGHTPTSLGLELFRAAQRGDVALSDAQGCAALLCYTYPGLTRRCWRSARRVAIDLQGQAARSPDIGLIRACRRALTLVQLADRLDIGSDAHALLDDALNLLTDAVAVLGSHTYEPPLDEADSPKTSTNDDWPDNAFALFIEAYPRKVGHARAEQALRRVRNKGGTSFTTILEGVRRLAAERREQHFVPYPSTWLHARRWEQGSVEPPEKSTDQVES